MESFAKFIKSFEYELSVRRAELHDCSFEKILEETYVHHFTSNPKLKTDDLNHLRQIYREAFLAACALQSSATQRNQTPEAKQ